MDENIFETQAHLEKRSKVREFYNNNKKRRKWDMNNISIDIKDDNDPVEYITKKIKKVCYEEAKRHFTAKHKLYHALDKKRKCLEKFPRHETIYGK